MEQALQYAVAQGGRNYHRYELSFMLMYFEFSYITLVSLD